MKTKKGAAGLQFNWIFILIAGAAVFILFSSFIARQNEISDASANALILKSLDAILSGREASAGTANIIKIPKTKIEFGCNSYAIGGISKQLTAISVFTPSVLEGNEIASMTLEWSIPYRTANLVYLTNPETRHIFIGNSDFAREIYESIPDEIGGDGYTQVQAIQDENDAIVRIIFFDQDPALPENLKGVENKAVTALKVNGDKTKGALEFFDLVGDKFVSAGKSYYIGRSALFGAVFTDNLEIYECVTKKSFDRMKVVSQVYKKKLNSLFDHYQKNGDSCKEHYSDENIQAIIDAASIFSQSSINEIDEATKNLEEQNRQAQLFSCAAIY